MKQTASTVAVAALVLGIFAFGIWWKVSVWQECRTTHSWMYCMQIIGGSR